MKTIHLTKADFLKKVADYEKEPAGVEIPRRQAGAHRLLCHLVRPLQRTLSPVLEELAAEYGDQIYIYKVDTGEEQELAAVFGIRSVPSLLFIPREGQPQMALGAMPKGLSRSTSTGFCSANSRGHESRSRSRAVPAEPPLSAHRVVPGGGHLAGGILPAAVRPPSGVSSADAASPCAAREPCTGWSRSSDPCRKTGGPDDHEDRSARFFLPTAEKVSLPKKTDPTSASAKTDDDETLPLLRPGRHADRLDARHRARRTIRPPPLRHRTSGRRGAALFRRAAAAAIRSWSSAA